MSIQADFKGCSTVVEPAWSARCAKADTGNTFCNVVGAMYRSAKTVDVIA